MARKAVASISVGFAEHISQSQISSMTSTLAVGANVVELDSDREFEIQVFKPKNLSYLQETLVQWEVHGFVRWKTNADLD